MNFDDSIKNGHNYYEILEVPPDAPQNEIHEAFKRAKKTYCQDSPALYSMFSREEAKELMSLIEEAFSVLGNQAFRKAYDERLRNLDTFSEENDNSYQPETDSRFDMAIPEAEPMDISSTIEYAGESFEPFPHSLPPQELSNSSNQELEQKKLGKTALSHYEIDEDMELEISEQSLFDGTFLKKVREYRQISLPKLSDHTRVGQAYLIAIEANDYPQLPAPVFVRGFILQIAKAIGLDPQAVSTSYMKLFKSSIKK